MENPHYETGSQDLVTIGAGEFMVSAYYSHIIIIWAGSLNYDATADAKNHQQR